MKFVYSSAFLLLTLLPLFSFAQSEIADGKLGGVLPLENGQVIYKETYAVPGLSKDEVFRRARRWWVYTYKSSKDVLQLSDDKTGELIGKGYGQAQSTGKRLDDNITFFLWNTISFDAKEGEYSVQVRDLLIQNSIYAPKLLLTDYKRSPAKNLHRVLVSTDEHVKNLLASLNQYILTEK